MCSSDLTDLVTAALTEHVAACRADMRAALDNPDAWGALSGTIRRFAERQVLLRDDAVRMADKLRSAGSDVAIEVWPRMPHAWHLYARILPEGRDAVQQIGTFLRSKL